MRMAAHHGVEALFHRNREDIGVMGEKQVGRAGDDKLLGIHQIVAIPARSDSRRRKRSAYRYPSGAGATRCAEYRCRISPPRGFIILAADKSLMITQTAEDTRIGAKPSEFANERHPADRPAA